MVTRELPRFISAAFSGATWLNWTEDRQPTKPLDAAWATFSLKLSLPEDRGAAQRVYFRLGGWGGWAGERRLPGLTGDFAQCQGSD